MKLALAVGLLAALLAAGCAPAPPLLDWSEDERAAIATLSPLPPPPPDPTNAWADSPEAAELGRRLFFDPRLSPDGRFACATCHVPEAGLSDGRPRAQGRVTLRRHVPSLWNVGHQRWFTWDGGDDTLWGQAATPIEHPDEMASDRLFVVRRVAAEPALRRAYEALFGELPPVEDQRFPEHARPRPAGSPEAAAWDAMAPEDREAVSAAFANLLKCLAAFERSLSSGESPFDRFARGLRTGRREELAALSLAEQRGLRVFLGPGRCVLCHHGPLLSDREFHDTRVPPLDGGPPRDPGRWEGLERLQAVPEYRSFGPHSDAPEGERARLSRAVVREGRSWGEFRTPGLRQVALSPPYMHQGQLESLEAVVRYYSTLEGANPLGHHQETLLAPAELDAGQQADLVAFLRSLTGDAPPPSPR